MAGIYGLSSLVLDNKGRIAMPAKYKEQLRELAAGSLIVTRDPQYPSLLIYPGNLWKEISSSFENLSGLNPQKFELWSEKNWKVKELGKEIKGERIDIELPEEVRRIPF